MLVLGRMHGGGDGDAAWRTAVVEPALGAAAPRPRGALPSALSNSFSRARLRRISPRAALRGARRGCSRRRRARCAPSPPLFSPCARRRLPALRLGLPG
eukprot:10501096-Alexandrium_andersonii.AAC.1